MTDKNFRVKKGLDVAGPAQIDDTLHAKNNAIVTGDLDVSGNITGHYVGFDSDFAEKNTDALTEGSNNLYYQSNRADSDFDARLATKTTTDVAEGSNLYYTDTRVDTYLQSGTVSQINFDSGDGVLSWNETDGTLDLAYADGVTLQIGQEEHFYAKALEPIDNGDIVMFAGAQGNHLLIKKADQTSVGFRPTYVMGIATQDFSLNQFGYATSFGKVRDLNTNLFNEGDLIYLDPAVAGGWTITEPTPAQGHSVLVAAVTRSHNNQGTVFVRTTHHPDTGEIPENGSNLYYTTARHDSDFDARLATRTTSHIVEGDNLYYTTSRADSAWDAKLLTITTDDVAQGSTNLYWSNSLFDTALATKTTDNVTEGTTNKYYSSTLFDTDFATKSTTDVAEGDNLYYTTARADSDAKQAISLVDVSGTGGLTYADGVFTYNGSTDSATIALFSVVNASGDGTLSFDNVTGVFTYHGAEDSDYRNAMDVASSGDRGSLAYDPATGFYTFTGIMDSDTRSLFNAQQGTGHGSVAYNAATGVTTINGSVDSDYRAAFAAGLGVHYDASIGEFSIGQPVETTSSVVFEAVTADSASLTSINLTPTSQTFTKAGSLYYDSNHQNGLTFIPSTEENPTPGVKLNVGQEQWIYVHNNSGATINNGSAVFVTGTIHGSHPTVALAKADAAATSHPIGVATMDIPDGGHGYVTKSGLVRHLDTSGMTEGAEIYLSADSDGCWHPTSVGVDDGYPFHIGSVVKADATEGVILVNRETEHFPQLRVDDVLRVSGNLHVDSATHTDLLQMSTDKHSIIDQPPFSEGLVWYNNHCHALMYNNEEMVIRVGQDDVNQVYNNTGSAIAAGKAVYLSGSANNLPTIALARADNESTIHKILGFTGHEIPNGSRGYVISRGIIGSMDTSKFSAGDILHVSPDSEGEVVAYNPEYPYYPHEMGIVLTSDSANGGTFGGMVSVIQRSETLETLRVSGNTRFDADVTVAGNLSILGNETTTTVASLATNDPFIYVGGGDQISTEFNGTGANDGFIKSYYTGDSAKTFYIEVVATDPAGDTIRWWSGVDSSSGFGFDSDGGDTTWDLGADNTLIPLRDHLRISFTDPTGHTIGDVWSGYAEPTNKDFGIVGNYNTPSDVYKHAGMFRDASDGKFKFFDNYIPEPEGDINTTHASFELAELQVDKAHANEFIGPLTGNADTATILQTNRNIGISGDVTGTATAFNGSTDITIAAEITAGSIVNADVNANAGIVDTKLGTISTAGKVQNSATTATNLNTASAIVARDASGNFVAQNITADGTVSGLNVNGTNITATVGIQSPSIERTSYPVTSGVYGSPTKIPVLNVNTSGFIDSIGEVGIAGVSGAAYDSSSGVFTINTSDGGSVDTTLISETDRIAEARTSVSASDAGGLGSLGYDNTTGAFTYTGPSDADIQGKITGGTGVTVTTGEVAIGQSVGTTDDVTFNSVITDTVTSTGTLNIAGGVDASGTIDATDTVTVDGTADASVVLQEGGVDAATFYHDASENEVVVKSHTDADDVVLRVNATDVVTATSTGIEIGGDFRVGTSPSAGVAGQILTSDGSGNAPYWQTLAASGIQLGDLSATTASAGTQNFEYDSVGGVFTFTPADLSAYFETSNFDTTFDTRLATKSTTDVAEGTNLYYTKARVDSDIGDELGTLTTTNVAEGTNLYFTNTRFDSRFTTQFATKTTTDLSEGNNLYYTKTRVDSDIDEKITTIDHDTLTNFVANEHVDHSSVSITAGNGLVGGGDITQTRSVGVGAGAGVVVNTDSITLDSDHIRTFFSAGGDISYNNTTGVISTTKYTDADVYNSLTIVDNGGLGSLGWNSGTGTLTYTGPSDAEVQALITGGTNIDVTNGVVSLDLPTGTNNQVLKTDGAGNYSWDSADVQVIDISDVQNYTLGTAGQVMIIGSGDDNVVADDTLFVDPINNGLGINTNSPEGNLHVVGNITYLQNNSNGTFGHAVGFRKSRGTTSSPTAVSNGDILMEFGVLGHNGSGYQYRSAMYSKADTSVGVGATLEFHTGQNASPTERLKIASSGEITFNNAYEFPTSDGTAGQVLTTDGAGNLTFSSEVLFSNVYSTLGDLPSASTYHGMFAHVHATGKAYYAHAGNWVELANVSELGSGGGATDATALNAGNTSLNLPMGNTGDRVFVYDASADSAAWSSEILHDIELDNSTGIVTKTEVDGGTSTVDLNGSWIPSYLDSIDYKDSLGDVGITAGIPGQVLTQDSDGGYSFQTSTLQGNGGVYTIWAEEGGGIGTNISSGYQWSFGNGHITNSSGGVLIPTDSKIFFFAIRTNTNVTGNCTIDLKINGVTVTTLTLSSGTNQETVALTTPISVSQGDRIVFRTSNSGGTSRGGGGAIVSAGFAVNEVPTDVTLNDIYDVNVSGATNGQTIVYNSTSGNWEADSIAGGSVSAPLTLTHAVSATPALTVENTAVTPTISRFTDGTSNLDVKLPSDGKFVLENNTNSIEIDDGSSGVVISYNNTDAITATAISTKLRFNNTDRVIAGTNGVDIVGLNTYNKTVGTASVGSGLIIVNASSGSIQKATLDQNVSFIGFSGSPLAGTEITLILTQDGTGSRTFTDSVGMIYAADHSTLSTGAGEVDIMHIRYDGTNYYAELAGGGGTNGGTVAMTRFRATKASNQALTTAYAPVTDWTEDVNQGSDYTFNATTGEVTFNTSGNYTVIGRIAGVLSTGTDRSGLGVRVHLDTGSGYAEVPETEVRTYNIRNTTHNKGVAETEDDFTFASGDKIKLYARRYDVSDTDIAGNDTVFIVRKLSESAESTKDKLTDINVLSEAQNAMGNTSGSFQVDNDTANIHTLTATNNLTFNGFQYTGASYVGQTVTLFITQDGTGSRTWNTNVTCVYPGGASAHALSTAAGAEDMVGIYYDGSRYVVTITNDLKA